MRSSISKSSFRRLSLSVSEIHLEDRDSDDEFSDQEVEIQMEGAEEVTNIDE